MTVWASKGVRGGSLRTGPAERRRLFSADAAERVSSPRLGAPRSAPVRDPAGPGRWARRAHAHACGRACGLGVCESVPTGQPRTGVEARCGRCGPLRRLAPQGATLPASRLATCREKGTTGREGRSEAPTDDVGLYQRTRSGKARHTAKHATHRQQRYSHLTPQPDARATA